MHVYVLLKGIANEELEKYKFLYDQHDFKVITWDKDTWEGAREVLYTIVKPYCIWKLVIIDTGEELKEEGDKVFEYIKPLLSDPDIKSGKGNLRPPAQIYNLMRRKRKNSDGCLGQGMEVSISEWDKVLPRSARFFFMDCEEQDYWQDFENLKLICAAIILGENELPEELTEAYCIYQIQIDVNEKWLKIYLEHQEKLLLEQRNNIDKRQSGLEQNKENGSYVIYDYLPEIMAGSFKKLVLKYRYCIIKKKKDLINWYSDVAGISADIERYQRGQQENHRRMRTELNQRLGVLVGTELYLDEMQEQEINHQIEKVREELVPYYTEVWRLNKNLSEKKEKIEKKIEYILKKRKTWKDISQIIRGMYFFIFLLYIPFWGLYLAELEVLQKIQGYGWKLDEPQIGLEVFAIAICFLCMGVGAILLFFWFIKDKMRMAKKEYINILKQINEGFKKNYDWYKKFFSLTFQLRSFRKVLLRSKGYQKREEVIRANLRNEKERVEKNLKRLKEFNEKFIILIEEDIKDGNLWKYQNDGKIAYGRKRRVKVNEEEILLSDVPPFVKAVSLVKETYFWSGEGEKKDDVYAAKSSN